MQTSLAYIFAVVSALLVGHQKTSQFQCGVRQIKHIETIVAGEVTAPGDWPWHAAIFHKRGHSLDYACGGTLISDHHVLTAQHCVSVENGRQMLTKNIFVQLGLYILHMSQNSQTHDVDRIVRYVGTAVHEAKRSDIALIELKSVADRTAYVQPACVNQVENIAGMIGTIVGWGYTEDEEVSDTLRSTQLLIRTTDECIEAHDDVFGPAWHGGIFCAGYTNGTSACNGDSGGGLFLQRDNVWYLTGIISFTEKGPDLNTCKSTGYTAFTKISKYLMWIQTNINSYSPVISQFPRDCGIYQVNRIAQGQKANIFEFPWVAEIDKIKNNKKHLATGTLISKRYVLTSIWGASGENLTVILGEHTRHQERDCSLNDPSECAPPIEKYPIDPKNVKLHEDANGFDSDVALIRLNRDVIFKDHIRPICLPTTSALIQLSLPQYVVTAWGRDRNTNNLQSTLHKAKYRAVDFERCKAIYAEDDPEDVLTGNQFCAGGDENGSDLCATGGTPIGYIAQHEAGLRFVQFGFVVVWPRKCGEFPSAYLKVANYMGWIALNMKP